MTSRGKNDEWIKIAETFGWKRRKRYEDDELGYLIYKGQDMKDFRKSSTYKRFPNNDMRAVFGTDNSLFEQDAKQDSRFLEGGMSCQYSSAVWCREALRGNPEMNVHEKRKHSISTLYMKMHPKRWRWNIYGPTAGQNLIKLVKEIGLVGKWIPGRSQVNVLKKAIEADGMATLIQMRSHAIAAFAKNVNEIYFFDNTVGCLKFRNKRAVDVWLEWVCNENDEGKKISMGFGKKRWEFTPWTGIKCKLATYL